MKTRSYEVDMSPIDKAKAAIKKNQDQGCKPNSDVEEAIESYERQAEAADRMLRKKQAKDRNPR
jgi:hypothetical protein